jgi:MYXO-CTERM domain-containing protein
MTMRGWIAGASAIVMLTLLSVPSTARAAEVMCSNEAGECTISNDGGVDSSSCTCEDGGGDETGGGSEWADLSEDELLEICYDHLSVCGAGTTSEGTTVGTSVGTATDPTCGEDVGDVDAGEADVDEGGSMDDGVTSVGTSASTDASTTAGTDPTGCDDTSAETGTETGHDTGATDGGTVGDDGSSGAGDAGTTGGDGGSSSGAGDDNASNVDAGDASDSDDAESSEGDAGAGDDDDAKGCGCDVDGSDRNGWLGLAALGLVAVRKRRRRA